MNPRISMITLGTTDLHRAIRFYRDGLGFPMHEASGGDVAFFNLQGTWLAVWPRHLLAEDALTAPQGVGFRGFALAHNTTSKVEVDAVLRLAEAAGASIVKPAHDTFWGGYSGYFSDPDGFLWEVAWNPFLPLA